jgi:hypothetical protein
MQPLNYGSNARLYYIGTALENFNANQSALLRGKPRRLSGSPLAVQYLLDGHDIDQS